MEKSLIGEEYYNQILEKEIDNRGYKKSVLLIFNNRDQKVGEIEILTDMTVLKDDK